MDIDLSPSSSPNKLISEVTVEPAGPYAAGLIKTTSPFILQQKDVSVYMTTELTLLFLHIMPLKPCNYIYLKA